MWVEARADINARRAHSESYSWVTRYRQARLARYCWQSRSIACQLIIHHSHASPRLTFVCPLTFIEPIPELVRPEASPLAPLFHRQSARGILGQNRLPMPETFRMTHRISSKIQLLGLYRLSMPCTRWGRFDAYSPTENSRGMTAAISRPHESTRLERRMRRIPAIRARKNANSLPTRAAG